MKHILEMYKVFMLTVRSKKMLNFSYRFGIIQNVGLLTWANPRTIPADMQAKLLQE